MFEIRAGRKLARRFWYAGIWGLTKLSSRQDERSTMNCSDSKGRCRGVVVFVSVVGRGERRGNNFLCLNSLRLPTGI